MLVGGLVVGAKHRAVFVVCSSAGPCWPALPRDSRHAVDWKRVQLLAAVDESGHMAPRDGEIHTMAMVVFDRAHLHRVNEIANTVRDVARIRLPDFERIKGRDLNRDELLLFVDLFKEVGHWAFPFKKLCGVETKSRSRDGVWNTATALYSLHSNLDQPYATDPRAREAIRLLEEQGKGREARGRKPEGKGHPVYTECIYWCLRNLAHELHQARMLPEVSLVLDRGKFKNVEVPNLLMRFVFHVQFGADLGLSLPDVFGLTSRKDLSSSISTDGVHSFLFIADVIAVIQGRVDREEDPDGFHGELLAQLRLGSPLKQAQFPRSGDATS